MGQAAVDLPDPLNTPDTPGGNADDLLAQLAGDEIDRLLAESDADNARPPVDDAFPTDNADADTQAPDADAAAADDVIDGDAPQAGETVEAVVDEAPQAPAGSAITVDVPAAVETPDTATPKLSVFASESVVADDPVAAFDAAEAPDEAPVEKIEDLDSAIAGEANSLLPAEATQANGGQDSADLVAAEMDADAALAFRTAAPTQVDAEPAAVPIPLVLKPLVWMNAPFAALPDWVRDLLGKVAILTLFNALAVLLYVLLFGGQ